ncbi:type 1 glutamine amidotransferase domain-containing protein [Mitsuokella sp. WILCCON 0060]|uniref:type 1 glutamine amidotransferase domain-containing protein n=1 Tax=unclassified Mitsuokella TaxID=2637239 RepID=UPI003EFBFD7A
MKQLFLFCLAAILVLPFFSSHSEAAASKGKILVVASSQQQMELADKSIMNVGFFLNEFAVPTEYLAGQGYEIVLATPSGAMPVMDKGSNDKKFFGGDEQARAQAVEFVNGLKPISLKDAIDGGLGQYAAVFVPGGHAPMTDLMQDQDLGTILRYFHEKQKPTAFICHGPAAMLAALPDPAAYRQALVSHDAKGAMAAAKGWIYNGYEMTVLSDAEEWPGEVAKGTEMPFHVEQALQIAGGKMRVDGMYGSHVVHDRELITGQNPASDIELAKELAKTLQAK